NLRPLDVPELTDEQISRLLAFDSPGLPEGKTTPDLKTAPDFKVEPGPQPTRPLLASDTTPIGMDSEFDPTVLTPAGRGPVADPNAVDDIPTGVGMPTDDEDPYADLNLSQTEPGVELADLDDSGWHPTNPFIRDAQLQAVSGYTAAQVLEKFATAEAALE